MTEPRPKSFALIRRFALADFITLANAACGTAAIFACLHHLDEDHRPDLIIAVLVLLPMAFIFDAADGAVARWRRKSSPYGGDLDSLADIISFGVAPAVLGFTLGLRGLWDALVLIVFVCCGIGRLARFNVTAEALSDERGKVAYFEGTPIPTSLVLVVVLGIAFWQGAVGDALWGGVLQIGPGKLHPLVLMFALSGGMMISEKLRIPKP